MLVRATSFRLTWVSTRIRSASTRSPTWSWRVRDWGYAWDRLLVFTTGGWTWANIENTHCSSITGICGGIGPGNGVSSSNNGWYAGGGFDYVVHKGALVDMIFGVEYQHFDLNGARAFCVRPGCAPPAVRDFDLHRGPRPRPADHQNSGIFPRQVKADLVVGCTCANSADLADSIGLRGTSRRNQ